MSLQFLRLGRNAVLAIVVEPAAGPKDFGVLAPDGSGEVDGGHRDNNKRAFGDRQGIDQFSGCCVDRFRERQHIIFKGLHIKDESARLSRSTMTAGVLYALFHASARGHGGSHARRHRDREKHS